MVAGGSAASLSFFDRALNAHGCSHSTLNIAVPGTTAGEWDTSEEYSTRLSKAVADRDEVWITLMGNDAMEQMPDCARQGGSASDCGDQLYDDMTKHMGSILDSIHESNPDANVVGFGYDTMFVSEKEECAREEGAGAC